MYLLGCSARRSTRNASPIAWVRNWVCVYNASVSPNDVSKFDLAVLDADSHPDLATVQQTQTILLGYVSLAEVGNYRWFWREIANEPWVLEKNPNWDSHMIDVREKAWHRFILEKIIPPILENGFDGLFLDTIDTAEYLEKYHQPGKYPGAQAAMVRLIRAMRKQYPDVILVTNRGFSMLGEFGDAIDGVVAESVFTSIDFDKNTTIVQPEFSYQAQLKQLKKMQKKYGLQVLTLDYFTEHNDARIKTVIELAREHEFVPFISSKNLDKIYFHTIEDACK